ncbi:MAG TPA: iron dicitrate transport regulator FecR [Alteromonas australica]|uniref:Iron dicitrate transport regulator FecR n=1 Tax=Alteromonas australica TaxID=589873 RepID=A0A350P0E9_9ALTE|nr:FecR domain-containing protein [Alteromonas australica]MBU34890.1 iron dicitrate transport regulator FecR [Alteromonas sp.]HAI71328.1 iron dicitrate transport regulator FecR [Alteromonas australica]HAU26492.1 iron dicitrate transport regulator FecR [Alteromonas australica]HAW74766.1 iron dicitrate transport regulator FecR [Alteromonas australica]HBU51595.1 iron dicitrate transport regulator FecR [Alteromonas australica]|tara:strand:+ start:751 stop:1740 length:990 start_codon:yes stop_codon:yes gene_type:complete
MTSDANTQSKINQTASNYVVRLYSGELTAKEEQDILAWCNESERHQSAFDKAIKVWDAASALPMSIGWREKLEGRFYHIRYMAASIVVALFCLTLYLHHSLQGEPSVTSPSQHYATAIGEVSNVGLSDGSTITLNTDTAVTVTFSAQARELWLLKGEAFFDIAKAPARPFLIHTGDKTIRVVGTKFNVKLSDSGFDIAVAEGIVAIEEATSRNAANPEVKPEPVLLEAGAMATFNHNNALIAKQNKDVVDKAQSWRSGYLRFDDERLDKIIESFNRYRTKKIVVDEEVSSLRISGVFKLSEGDAILTALEATLPIDVQKSEENITVVKK